MDLFSKLRSGASGNSNSAAASQGPQRPGNQPAHKQKLTAEEEDEQAIIAKYEEQREGLWKLIAKEYRLFDFKINNCMYQCYGRAKDYSQMGACKSQCEAGSYRFTEFVKGQVDNLVDSVHSCLEKTKQESAHGDQYERAKTCYRTVMGDMQKLRTAIRQQSRYYQ